MNKKQEEMKTAEFVNTLGSDIWSIKENVNNINIPHLHFGMRINWGICKSSKLFKKVIHNINPLNIKKSNNSLCSNL